MSKLYAFLKSKLYPFLVGVGALVTLLVSIKVGVGALLPTWMQDTMNAGFANMADAVFSVECDLAGEWKCIGRGCSPNNGRTKIEKVGAGYRLTNEKGQTAGGILTGARQVFVPAWEANKGGGFYMASADCKKLEALGDGNNPATWVR